MQTEQNEVSFFQNFTYKAQQECCNITEFHRIAVLLYTYAI